MPYQARRYSDIYANLLMLQVYASASNQADVLVPDNVLSLQQEDNPVGIYSFCLAIHFEVVYFSPFLYYTYKSFFCQFNISVLLHQRN